MIADGVKTMIPFVVSTGPLRFGWFTRVGQILSYDLL
jgi:hypothetical protein